MRWGTAALLVFSGLAVLVIVAGLILGDGSAVAFGVAKLLGLLLWLIGIACFYSDRQSEAAAARRSSQNAIQPAQDVETDINRVVKEVGKYDPHKEVADAVRRGDKLEAIKIWRDATGVNLRDALKFVEEVERRTGRG